MTLAVGPIDANNDTCGLATSGPCYVVVVGNSGDQNASPALAFAPPTATAAKTTGVLGNAIDRLHLHHFPIGDSVSAVECDAGVTVPTTMASHCDAATTATATATASSSGTIAFRNGGITLRAGGAFSDSAAGTCPAGGDCDILVTDAETPVITFTLPVTFATPVVKVAAPTGILPGTVHRVVAKKFPVGDSITAEECDSSVDPATNLVTNCDPATAITGTVGATGTVAFTSTGVTVVDGAFYTESGSGSVVPGGAAAIVVNDTSTSGFTLVVPITMHS